MNTPRLLRFLTFTAGFSLTAPLHATIVNYDAPTLDKWVYPFASNGGGTRTSAPVFGAVGGTAGSFDDRDGQMLVGFDTAADVPTGLGSSSYLITSARLTLTMNINAADSVVYDGTYDPISTLDPATGAPINGDDAGRPVELYGVGYRNGFTATSLTENSAYAFGDPTAEGVRNFYATDFLNSLARDVSNNVRDGFDPSTFAVGQVDSSGLNGDGTIQGDTDMVFTFNLSLPGVVAYLQQALNLGRLNLMATSMHQASQGGPATRPEFDTKELGLAGTPARLFLEVQVVPEPSTALLLGAGLLAGLRVARRNPA